MVKGAIYLIISVRNTALQDKTIYSNKWLYSRFLAPMALHQAAPCLPSKHAEGIKSPPVHTYRAEPGQQLCAT